MELSTRAVHAGLDPDPTYGSVIPAIHQTSTYAQRAVGEFVGDYDYARSANPTRAALERALGELEGGAAVAFSSGLAAAHAVITHVCASGDHVVLPSDLYGGTYRLVDKVLTRWGLRYDLVDQTDLDALGRAVTDDTRLIWVETPTNPLLNVVDVAEVVARRRNAVVVVDNTFATPINQRPLELGADVVVHSTTKYVGGHSDVVGGALVVAQGAQLPVGVTGPTGPALADALAFHQNASGAVAGPFDAWLTLRGLKTLPVRMERHCANALAVARFLAEHSAVREVIYPGLPGHPGHEVAARQMSGFGGMVSFRAASAEAALECCARTRVFTLAESLGGVESLIEHPARMTHASVAGSALEVPDDLVRLSVGLEDVADLVGDLAQALA